MDEQSTATVESDVPETVAYWRDRAGRAERALTVERERHEFMLAAIVAASDGRVRFV